ncbi:hypothetical protein SFMTTN_0955 [Sulfuriferula multivorans]|uniref:Uncharacterized protein n=1 Tax=Sulfuriferula multivorans TaxID=1559896 RepID=A0A401JBW7_9PROT|nr:hypothetical protein SFMTTN_0955 [Sulfuriferula multivorans]
MHQSRLRQGRRRDGCVIGIAQPCIARVEGKLRERLQAPCKKVSH